MRGTDYRLRPYQVDASDALCEAFLDRGLNRLLVKKPTGTGKTVWFASLLRHPRLAAWLQTFPPTQRRMIVIAHREELLDQAADKIRAANPGILVSIEQADRHANAYSDVVIASIQTLSARKCTRLHRLLARMTFRLVVVDEAHHAAAPSYRNALVHLGFLPPNDESNREDAEAVDYDDVALMEKALQGWNDIAPKDRLLLGVTATPNRTDAIGLGCVFQSIAYSYDLRKAIDDEWLVPIRPWVIETHTGLDGVHTVAGDFNQRELAEAVNTATRNQLAVSAWKAHADGRSTIAFTVDVAHAHDLAAAFRAVGVPAEALSGETPREERHAILQRFTAGTLEVVTNCMVLTEGTDLPRTSCILHAKPTKSATLYEQMTGRGLRLFPGKPDCVLIDLVDVARRHSLQTAPVLYGLPPGCKTEGELLQELHDAMEKFREAHPNFDIEAAFAGGVLSLAQLHAKAATFDVWTVPALGAFGLGRALNWIRVAAEEFRLQYPWADGVEILTVAKDLLGKWVVSLTLRPAQPPYVARQRTLAQEIDTADGAAGIAEQFVLRERRGVANLKDKSASWRQKGPSPKQLALLKKMRVPLPPGPLTAGKCSDLIDLAMARRGRR
jgi:ATP-dependent helicase IRC3